MNPEDSDGVEPVDLAESAGDAPELDEFLDDDLEDGLDDELDGVAPILPDAGVGTDPAAPTVAMATLPVTGEPRVDDALARLADLTALPVDEHVGVFEDVQRRLHDTLADLTGQP